MSTEIVILLSRITQSQGYESGVTMSVLFESLLTTTVGVKSALKQVVILISRIDLEDV
jgi:hypothetical protein